MAILAVLPQAGNSELHEIATAMAGKLQLEGPREQPILARRRLCAARSAKWVLTSPRPGPTCTGTP
jgi:hypothetical protein